MGNVGVMDSFVLETDDTEGNRTYRVADVELQADTVKVEHAFEVLKRHEREFLSLEGVVGTGLGVRENPNEAIIEVYAIEPQGVVRAALTDFLEGVEVEVIPGDFDVEALGKFIDIEEFYSEPVLPATLIPTPTPTPTPTPVPIPRPTPTPTPIPTPDFTLSCLRVVPESLVAGEEVMAEVTVDNEGGVEGTYEVTMLVDGVQVETKEATVTGGGSRTISFLYSPRAQVPVRSTLMGWLAALLRCPCPEVVCRSLQAWETSR